MTCQLWGRNWLILIIYINLILQIFNKDSSVIGTGEPVTWYWRSKGGRDIFLPMFNVGAGWDRASMSPGRFISGKESLFPFCRMRVSFEDKLDGCRKCRKILAFEPPNLQPVQIRFPGLGPGDTCLLCSLISHVWQISVAHYRMRDMCHDSTTYFELIVGNNKAFSHA